MRKRIKTTFSGTVQGVGFRYTTQQLSSRFLVTGYVKNLVNGDVEVVAEGAEEDLRSFVEAIRESSLQSYIRDVKSDWHESTGEFDHFGIAY